MGHRASRRGLPKRATNPHSPRRYGRKSDIGHRIEGGSGHHHGGAESGGAVGGERGCGRLRYARSRAQMGDAALPESTVLKRESAIRMGSSKQKVARFHREVCGALKPLADAKLAAGRSFAGNANSLLFSGQYLCVSMSYSHENANVPTSPFAARWPKSH